MHFPQESNKLHGPSQNVRVAREPGRTLARPDARANRSSVGRKRADKTGNHRRSQKLPQRPVRATARTVRSRDAGVAGRSMRTFAPFDESALPSPLTVTGIRRSARKTQVDRECPRRAADLSAHGRFALACSRFTPRAHGPAAPERRAEAKWPVAESARAAACREARRAREEGCRRPGPQGLAFLRDAMSC